MLACSVWLAVLCATPTPDRKVLGQNSAAEANDRSLSAALCPIVYQADRVPSTNGYRYLFYGNGFFINHQGYVVTAAHVLSQLHGGQPSLLLRSSSGALAFVQAPVVALDRDHDVAVLLATPNPFDGDYVVSFLPLATESPQLGLKVLAAAIRPSNPRNAYTLEPTLEEQSPGDVINFEFSQLEKGRPDTELFLFSHPVQRGQSGGPVISLESRGVVGLVEGEWLRDANALSQPPQYATNRPPSTDANQPVLIPGAVIPIHYAVALLQQRAIEWHGIPQPLASGERTAGDPAPDSLPAPLSFVPAPYPAQSLAGGELLLDALVSSTGSVSSIRVVRGSQPFLQNGLAAVRTWTFVPARVAGQAVESHIAIAFVFPQPYVPPRASTIRRYDDAASVAAQDRAALPLTTVEPEYPVGSHAGGSVIIYGAVTTDGALASLKTVRDLRPLTQATLAALQRWHFAPARRAGTDVESAMVVVCTFRSPLVDGQIR